MADDDVKVSSISGTATREDRRRKREKWARPKDYVPPTCGNKAAGCSNGGDYIPLLKIWGVHDKQRTKRQVIVMLPVVLCSKHATTNPRDFVPDEKTMDYLRQKLGEVQVGDENGNVVEVQEEPDLDRMVVQYVGNKRVKVERAKELAERGDEDEGVEPLTGVFERYFDEDEGVVKTRRIGD